MLYNFGLQFFASLRQRSYLSTFFMVICTKQFVNLTQERNHQESRLFCSNGQEHDKLDEFDQIMVSFFGTKVDKSKNWNDHPWLQSNCEMRYQIILLLFSMTAVSSPIQLLTIWRCLRFRMKVLLSSSLFLSWNYQIKGYDLGRYFLQALCSISLLFIFAISIVPAFLIGKLLGTLKMYSTIQALGTGVPITWVWIPMIVPMWMLTFLLSIVVLKWIMIWKYKEGKKVS